MDRRTALKILAGGAAASATTGAAAARERREPPADAVGMLYDATRCIGCKACEVVCRRSNRMPPELAGVDDAEALQDLWDAPQDLSGSTRNIIKLAKDNGRTSFVKRQCMHCIDPACASVCMMSALSKGPMGVVTYDASRCIGCRYCQVACQFNIPKFEWESPTPKIVKCELCAHRLEQGGVPACCEVCPSQAVVFGSRQKLLEDARERITRRPDRYEPHIYGEEEAGGTQVLYLTAKGFPFEKLGLPDLGEEPVPELAETIQHGVYRGFIAPAALYATLGVVLLRNREQVRTEVGGEEGAS